MKRILFALLWLLPSLCVEAREVYPLNEGWRFYFKTENDSEQARTVTLPHTWNTSPVVEGSFLETTGNYLQEIYLPEEFSSQRLFIKFYGAQRIADLFVNGRHVGGHRGGGVAFAFEITDKVRFGANNTLQVVVNNAYREDLLPASTDANLYGGLNRPVELILTAPTAISPLYYGSEGVLVHTKTVTAEQATGEVEVHLTSLGEQTCPLHVEIADPSGKVVFSKQQRVRLDGKPAVVPFVVAKPQRWSLASPNLYSVRAWIGEERVSDQVVVRTGFRSLVVEPSAGLLLNGDTVAVRGVTLYHDNIPSGGLLTQEDYDCDLTLARQMGANALRSGLMPHADYLYTRCDEVGMLAWIDLPFHRSAFLGDVAYYATEAFEKQGENLLREIIIQHQNHPSVAMWGLFSHLWMRGDNPTPYIKRLHQLARKLDPLRPTVACSNQNGDLNFVTDLVVWQQDLGWGRGKTEDVALWRDHLQQNWAHLRSGLTYGGEGNPAHQHYMGEGLPNSRWTPEARQTRFHEEYAYHLKHDSLFWGVWVANLCDYGSARRTYGVNYSGLVSIDRKTKKDAYYLYRALWNSQVPTLHLTEKRRTVREEGVERFSVYSSVGEPTMLLGGDTVLLQAYGPCQYRADSVVLVRGEVKVKVMAGGLADSVTLRVGNTLTPRQPQAPLQTAGPQTTN